MKPAYLAATLALLALTGKGIAHEFWIDADSYSVGSGETVSGQLRVGQEFVGSTVSYLPVLFETFEVISGDTTQPVEGRLGDTPALVAPDLPDGLAVVVHQTAGDSLTWSEWERFLNFANHKDLGDVTALHEERGLSQENVREDYIRYAKALIAVGDGAGADARVGLEAELVSLTNPYTEDTSEGVQMQLWYDGAPQPDFQVELFAESPDGAVTITLHRTDAEGIVTLPVEPGFTYMADSVFLEANTPESDTDPMWITHWANITFGVPE